MGSLTLPSVCLQTFLNALAVVADECDLGFEQIVGKMGAAEAAAAAGKPGDGAQISGQRMSGTAARDVQQSNGLPTQLHSNRLHSVSWSPRQHRSTTVSLNSLKPHRPPVDPVPAGMRNSFDQDWVTSAIAQADEAMGAVPPQHGTSQDFFSLREAISDVPQRAAAGSTWADNSMFDHHQHDHANGFAATARVLGEMAAAMKEMSANLEQHGARFEQSPAAGQPVFDSFDDRLKMCEQHGQEWQQSIRGLEERLQAVEQRTSKQRIAQLMLRIATLENQVLCLQA